MYLPAVAKLAWHGRERMLLLLLLRVRVRDGALVARVLK